MTPNRNRLAIFRVLFASIIVFAPLSIRPLSADISLSQANGDMLVLQSPAKRIITLAPNLAELVFAAGAGDHLKAVVQYSDFPPQVQQIPQVGDAFRIDIERIMALEPDLVVAWKTGNPQTALQKLEQLGIKVWQIEIDEPAEIADAVEAIALAAGTGAHGKIVAQKLRDRLKTLVLENAGKAPLDYFFQIASNPLYTVNGQHIISRSMEVCGGRNIFSALPSLAPQVSRESVILADPQVMIAPQIQGESPALANWNEWPGLQAVSNKTLLYLPADDISRAGPRLLDSIELACSLLDEVRRKGS